jgi:hypothetical protein
MYDLSMYDLSAWANVHADLHTRTAARANDLSLQPPGDARLVKYLQAVSGPGDMQVKALAAMLTLDV